MKNDLVSILRTTADYIVEFYSNFAEPKPVKMRWARIMNEAADVIENIPVVDAVEVSGKTKQAIALIVEERRRQIAEWGDQSDINPFEFMSILGEEFGELCQAVNETFFCSPKYPERGGCDAIIREAVQVAAVATQIIEAYIGQRREEENDGRID